MAAGPGVLLEVVAEGAADPSVLLVWLVVPVEAAGNAQAAGGVAAAVAAAAAGASTLLNYCAGLGDNTAGDLHGGAEQGQGGYQDHVNESEEGGEG